MQTSNNPQRPPVVASIAMGDVLVVLFLLSMGGLGLAMAIREGLRP